MSVGAHPDSPSTEPVPERGTLVLSGALLLVGFVVNAIQRMLLHPTGAEDDHEAIFREYAASDVWEATHFAEFVLVLVALAGLLVLCRALRRETYYPDSTGPRNSVSVEGNLAMAGNCLVGLITVTRQRDAAVVAEARP